MRTIIIEVRGGVVQEVYTDAKDLSVVLVDWDAGDDEEHPVSGGDFLPQPIASLPAETMSAILTLTSQPSPARGKMAAPRLIPGRPTSCSQRGASRS
jgi:hypothetical protein